MQADNKARRVARRVRIERRSFAAGYLPAAGGGDQVKATKRPVQASVSAKLAQGEVAAPSSSGFRPTLVSYRLRETAARCMQIIVISLTRSAFIITHTRNNKWWMRARTWMREGEQLANWRTALKASAMTKPSS